MKKFFCILMIFTLFSAVFAISADAYEVTDFEVTAENAMLVSLDTGEILYSKNAQEKVYPASITELMTAAVILESFPNPSEITVTMSQTAYDKILGTGSSVLNAKVGETFNGKDALACLLVSTAGDITYAYAETVSGSVEAFVDAMNAKAEELGLSDTHYQNPIGLHAENHYTTVNDIRILSEYLIKNYPIIAEITERSRYKIQATNMSDERILVSTNYMIDANTAYYYSYCTGLKTGFTDEAGRCFVSTAAYEGYNYLCIAMNCPTLDGVRTEFTTSKKLFKWAFTEFEYKAILDINTPVTEVPVRLSSDSDYVSVYPSKQVKAILPKEADNSSVITEPHLFEKSVDAPVKKGDVLGTADVIYAEHIIGTVELIAGNDVQSSTLLTVWDGIMKVITSATFKIIVILVLLSAVAFIAYVIYINRKSSKKARNIKYIPYSEEEELKRKEKNHRRRQRQGRPEYQKEIPEENDSINSTDDDFYI